MTTRKPKQQTTTPPTAPYVPSDYERGVLDALELLKQEVARLNDAKREADRLLWEASREVRSLLDFASPATNIAGDVENRVVARAMPMMDAERAKKRTADATPAASPR